MRSVRDRFIDGHTYFVSVWHWILVDVCVHLRKRLRQRVAVAQRDNESIALFDPVGQLVRIFLWLRDDESVALCVSVGQLVLDLVGL
jgi:hypothetical protein